MLPDGTHRYIDTGCEQEVSRQTNTECQNLKIIFKLKNSSSAEMTRVLYDTIV
jgi:hypothetical protein